MLIETESVVCPHLRQACKGQPGVRWAEAGPESLTGEEKLSSGDGDSSGVLLSLSPALPWAHFIFKLVNYFLKAKQCRKLRANI